MFATANTLPAMSRKPMPPSEKKVPVAARVDPDVFSAMQVLANADDRTLSYMVERAMREYVERHAGDSKRKPPAR